VRRPETGRDPPQRKGPPSLSGPISPKPNATPLQIAQPGRDAQSRPSLGLVEFRPARRGSLRGFASVRLPSGLVINDIVVGESSGRPLALLPSKAMLDRDGNPLRDDDGKVRYTPVNVWGAAELAREFSRKRRRPGPGSVPRRV
jgi:hypothetical protein